MNELNLKSVLEGLLFVVGEEGLTLTQIEDILSLTEDAAKELLSQLRDDYEKEDRGIRINFLGNTFKLTTKKEHKEYYRKLIENPETNVLSQAALETLAIVAYNQPVTKAFVEQIRGVDCSAVLGNLVVKGLVEERGRLELPGRPLLYGTTANFLRCLGITSLEELPPLPNQDSDKVEQTNMQENLE